MWHLVSEYLLLNADRLDIENIGTFTAKTIPAQIDESNKRAYPAKRIFEFTPQAEQTSESFIEFVAQKSGKSIDQAQKYIAQQIKNTIETKDKNTKIDLPLIGYLKTDEQGNLRLIQTINYSLTPDNFGFTDIPLPQQINKQTYRTKESKTAKKTKTAKATQKTTTKTKKEKQNSASILKATLITLSIAAIIILIFLFRVPIINFTTNTWNNLTHKQNKQQIDISTNPEKNITQTTQPQAENQTNLSQSGQNTNQTQPQTNIDNNTGQTTQNNTEQLLAQVDIKAHIYLGPGYKNYYLIAGSFTKLENANRFKQQLIREGYPNAGILLNDPTKKRVYISGYDSLEQAIEAYKQYKNRFPDRGIWLLINSNSNDEN